MQDLVPNNNVLPTWMRPWEQFWFTRADPTMLGLMRILCGLIVVYTLGVYTFALQDFMGAEGWHDLDVKLDIVRDRPIFVQGTLSWPRLPEPRDEFERAYRDAWRENWKVDPLPPYPKNKEQADYLHKYRFYYKVDLRVHGLRPPETEKEYEYLERYANAHRGAPPPYYVESKEEEDEIEDYIKRKHVDPRLFHTTGMPVFSLFFHVTDPTAMMVIHLLSVLVAVLFTIGFCTRISAALLWFASISYIHRNTTILFGVDTMMTILLLYLMIGPSGAAFSVDRVIARWWHGAKAGIVQSWYRLWRQPVPNAADIAPSSWSETVAPSVSANIAMRLLQIHICIIYFVAGISKLQGPTWWNGTALWAVIGNYEFAPMQFELYLAFLRLLGTHPLLFNGFLVISGLFTLVFEIGYLFLIWRPSMRWVFLACAIILHGGIGLFLGLKTFSLMMLVMNMAFVRKEEAFWVMRKVGLMAAEPAAAEAQAKPPVPSAATSPATGVVAASGKK